MFDTLQFFFLSYWTKRTTVINFYSSKIAVYHALFAVDLELFGTASVLEKTLHFHQKNIVGEKATQFFF